MKTLSTVTQKCFYINNKKTIRVVSVFTIQKLFSYAIDVHMIRFAAGFFIDNLTREACRYGQKNRLSNVKKKTTTKKHSFYIAFYFQQLNRN